MEFVLKNRELQSAVLFLTNMSLKAKDSRHRSKVLKVLNEAIRSVSESEMELAKRYGKVDKNNQLIMKDDGSFKPKTPEDKIEFLKEHNILMNEEVVIQSGMFKQNFEEFGCILSEYEGILSGEDASIYDLLVDRFEGRNNDAL
ncbi:DUF1617 family protein [Enterococcus faecium]|nr:DUF1617 family protein [Enterococcus faecium]